MGFCTSPWFAEIVLEYLEIKCLNRFKSSVMFYKIYVDDSFLIIKSNKIEHALSVFNLYNEHLRFTVENEYNTSSINFLDMKITRINNGVITVWYMKPTASGRCIHYLSHCLLVANPRNRFYKYTYSLGASSCKTSLQVFFNFSFMSFTHTCSTLCLT